MYLNHIQNDQTNVYLFLPHLVWHIKIKIFKINIRHYLYIELTLITVLTFKKKCVAKYGLSYFNTLLIYALSLMTVGGSGCWTYGGIRYRESWAEDEHAYPRRPISGRLAYYLLG